MTKKTTGNTIPVACAATVFSTLTVGSAGFVLSAPNTHRGAVLQKGHFWNAASEERSDAGMWTALGSFGLSAASVGALVTAVGVKKAQRGSSRLLVRALPQRKSAREVTAYATRSLTPIQEYNQQLMGDVIFDPLGFASADYFNMDRIFVESGLNFDKLRWYREAELMHGRVSMLASINLLLREVPLASGALPDEVLEFEAMWQFVQTMALIEAYRGYRLFFNEDQIAGDLGLGMGPVEGGFKFRWDMTREELADKQKKELWNSRLAMLAILGMVVHYTQLGHFLPNWSEVSEFEDPSLIGPVLSVLSIVLAFDGISRISNPQRKSTGMNTIAAKAINPLALSFGMQDPQLPLPSCVQAGGPAQQLQLSEEQIAQFQEDGAIMIKGGMKDWVKFLQATTEYQIEHPHVWSLVGRLSGMYDYIQRNTWMTNNGFRDFLYYSPLGHILAQLGKTDEIRVTTDMLLVNPNKGFGWHQDNQNGPIDFPVALRWWVAMDRCGQDDYGAPEYLLGSHKNLSVSDDAVFVDLQDGDLSTFSRRSKFVAEPGDLIIWDARTIHRIVAPPGQAWEEGTQRRAIGGTVAKAGSIYHNKGGASGISDLSGHTQKNGELLSSPYFPRIYPQRLPDEEEIRNNGELVDRSAQKIADLAVTLLSNAGKYVSFTKVVGKKD